MVAFKFTFVLSATVFSLTYAAPTYRAELEARTFEDAPEHFFARDLQQRPSSASPASLEGVASTFASTVRPHKNVLAGMPSGKRQWASPASLEGVTSTFASTVKPHRKDTKVLTGMPSGKRQWYRNSNHHGDRQRHHVLSSNIDGTDKPAKYASQTQELDSSESHPRLNKRLPPFPSKHHCPICHKSPKDAGYCKDHQWVCDDHNGRPWVQTKDENCQNCGNPPPQGKKNRR